MAGVKGMKGHCTGLSDAEVRIIVEKQYREFCLYRNELTSLMPDRRTSLFSKRSFDGRHFEIG